MASIVRGLNIARCLGSSQWATVLRLSGLLDGAVDTDDDGVVALEGLEGDLLEGAETVLLHLVDLRGEDDGGLHGGVDAVSLDGDAVVAAVLEEVGGVDGKDTGLVGLGNIHEDAVNHGDEHAVLDGVAGILDDGDDVGAALGHLDEVTAGAVGELNSVDHTLGADEVGDVGDGGTGGTAEVEDLGAGAHVAGLDTVVDGGGKLGAVGVPEAVLLLLALATGGGADLNALLAVDGDAGDHVEGAEGIGLGLGDEDAGVAHVGLDNDLSSGGTAAAATATATSTATAAEATTAGGATATTETSATTTAETATTGSTTTETATHNS